MTENTTAEVDSSGHFPQDLGLRVEKNALGQLIVGHYSSGALMVINDRLDKLELTFKDYIRPIPYYDMVMWRVEPGTRGLTQPQDWSSTSLQLPHEDFGLRVTKSEKEEIFVQHTRTNVLIRIKEYIEAYLGWLEFTSCNCDLVEPIPHPTKVKWSVRPR